MFQNNGKTALLAAATASLICLLLYLPVLRYGFINFDDPGYVLNNPVIRQLGPDSLSRMFLQSHVGWWMPLTWISFALDYHFWELNPLGYHLTNIVLHAVNAGLVVLIADRLCRDRFAGDPAYVRNVLRKGVERAREEGIATLKQVRKAMNMDHGLD